jgi:hypothetical protein
VADKKDATAVAQEENVATEVATETVVSETTKVILEEEQVLEIVPLDQNKPYANKGKGIRHAQGKTYAQFRYNGIVFNVPNDLPFPVDFGAGNVKKVSLIETKIPDVEIDDKGQEKTVGTKKGYEFDYHITYAQADAIDDNRLRDIKRKAQMKMYAKMDTQPITENFLIQLLNQA